MSLSEAEKFFEKIQKDSDFRQKVSKRAREISEEKLDGVGGGAKSLVDLAKENGFQVNVGDLCSAAEQAKLDASLVGPKKLSDSETGKIAGGLNVHDNEGKNLGRDMSFNDFTDVLSEILDIVING
ncbi:MAG: Nif11-like leader peptide family natural product precursor [Oscillospiraceae bacterium]|jgi:hypothetical protein|nr:Nif11-like leader peptide family natural product precursor [Oscillospiraceae bacterium]